MENSLGRSSEALSSRRYVATSFPVEVAARSNKLSDCARFCIIGPFIPQNRALISAALPQLNQSHPVNWPLGCAPRQRVNVSASTCKVWHGGSWTDPNHVVFVERIHLSRVVQITNGAHQIKSLDVPCPGFLFAFIYLNLNSKLILG